MRKFLLMSIVLFMFSASALYAKDLHEKKQATVRKDFKIELNGEMVELKCDIVIIDGVSYLPVKEVSQLYGSDVNFEGGVIKLDNQSQVTEVTEEVVEPAPKQEMTEREKRDQELKEITEAIKNGTFEKPASFYEREIEMINTIIESDLSGLAYLKNRLELMLDEQAEQVVIDNIRASIENKEKSIADNRNKVTEYTNIINK